MKEVELVDVPVYCASLGTSSSGEQQSLAERKQLLLAKECQSMDFLMIGEHFGGCAAIDILLTKQHIASDDVGGTLGRDFTLSQLTS